MAQMLIRVTKEMDEALKVINDYLNEKSLYLPNMTQVDAERTVIKGVYDQWKDVDETAQ